MLFRMKKPNYTEPMVGWNEDDKKTGLVKFGVTHYEPVASTVRKIPCPIRPPVIFVDHDEPGALEFNASDASDAEEAESGNLQLE